jgi:hypothetical protein
MKEPMPKNLPQTVSGYIMSQFEMKSEKQHSRDDKKS